MINYPIKFVPILKHRIWGGDKLATTLNKKTVKSNIGESWELSDIDGDISIVANGKLKDKSLRELLTSYGSSLLGCKNYKQFGNKFPLLIKFIDAKQDLSVQVHPNDELSEKRHGSFGKTEMWYVVQADEGARLILGFKETIAADRYVQLLKDKKIMEVLKEEPVKKGDAFFIETGTVHAIGSGIVLAEIQQTSDITYRIYDFDRTDALGNTRELHTDLAIDALNFSDEQDTKRNYLTEKNKLNPMVESKYFNTNFLAVSGSEDIDYSQTDSFVIFICVEGSAAITIFDITTSIEYGETVLIPAVANKVNIISEHCHLLEVMVS